MLGLTPTWGSYIYIYVRHISGATYISGAMGTHPKLGWKSWE